MDASKSRMFRNCESVAKIYGKSLLYLVHESDFCLDGEEAAQ